MVRGGCRGCAGWQRLEGVGAEAGAVEEAEPGPFAELGEQVAWLDVQEQGEFVAAPVSRWLAGDDGSDQVAACWPAGAELGCSAVEAAAAGAGVRWRGAHGDGDGSDGGDGVGSLVAVVEVAGGSALDLAGAEPGAPGGQQGGQDGSADGAGQVSGALRADSCCRGELAAGGFQGGGEAGPAGVGAGPGLDSGDHGHAQQRVEA